jgi:SAM-dependent methyltransferase
MPNLRWQTDQLLSLGDVAFDLNYTAEGLGMDSTSRCFVLQKSRAMVEWYAQSFAGRPGGNVLEIGIFKGGSVVLLDRLLQPRKMVAIEISKEPVAALDDYIAQERAHARLKPLFGVDQADAATLRRIIVEEFGDETIDIAIDDGCHLLRESRTSFDAIFPHVRPGGTYVIEDWGWAHWSHSHWQQGGGPWKDQPATTQLIFELVMLSASRPDIVESVMARSDLVAVVRGSAAVPSDFRLADAYLTAGRRFGELGLGGPDAPRRANSRRRLIQRALDVLRSQGPRGLAQKSWSWAKDRLRPYGSN